MISKVVFVMKDMLATTIASGSLVVASWLSVGIKPVYPVIAQFFAQQQQVPSSDNSIFEFALRQGGAFVILIVVLFYYRRDYRDLVAFKADRDAQLVDLVRESTRAQAEMAAALRENNIVVHQAKTLMRDILPEKGVA